ncbi:hypothetical protein GF373_10180 [bacterium]|nr:hypothetical protein [bacterium]
MDEQQQFLLQGMTESCEQLQSLLNKLVMTANARDCKKEPFRVVECLKHGLSQIEAEIHHPLFLDFQGNEEFCIHGNTSRFLRALGFLAQGLVELMPGGQALKIQIDQDLPEGSSYWRILTRNNKNWLHLSIFNPQGDTSIATPRDSFYDPDKPYDLPSCYLAAAENIIHDYKGKMEYSAEPPYQIHIYFPECVNLAEASPPCETKV